MSTEILNRLYTLGGLDRGAYAGIQFDMMPVPKHLQSGVVVDAGLCDHTCATAVEMAGTGKIFTGGCYDCDASAAFHKGTLDVQGLAPLAQLLSWLDQAALAMRIFHERFMERHFAEHCAEFEIGPDAAKAIKQGFEAATIIELNGFGGSPELHPDILSFAVQSQQRGFRFNTTTTGRKFLTDQKFVAGFLASPPKVLALSFDDLTPDELEDLLTMSYGDLRRRWQRAIREEPYHGQKHKALEGVYAGRWVTEHLVTGNENPPVLVMYNSVIHDGNISHLPQLVSTIARLMPKARLNPYLAQSVFEKESEKRVPCWKPEHLPKLEKAIHWLRDETLAGNPNLTMRLHHYLFLQAQFETFRNDPEELCRRLSGWDGWRADRRPGAYRYCEISGSGTPWGQTVHQSENGRSQRSVQPFGKKTQAGGHPGSYWYSWLPNRSQVHEYTPEALAERFLYRPTDTGDGVPEEYSGYIMPRPMFNILSHEAGMDSKIVPNFVRLRQEYFGY